MPAAPEPVRPAPPAARRPWGLTLLWLAPGLGLLGILVYGLLTRPPVAPERPTPRVGQPLPDFSLPDLHGNLVRLSALQGKVVFINIWATWCPPCVEEMPTIQRLYDRLHARGLQVLAVSLDVVGAQAVGPFMRQHRLTFPALLDPKSRIERLYHTTGVPESFIVDKQGRLVEKVVGPRDWAHPQVIAMFERLLAAPATGQHTSERGADASTAPSSTRSGVMHAPRAPADAVGKQPMVLISDVGDFSSGCPEQQSGTVL